jgi:hypothetical protein
VVLLSAGLLARQR